MSEDLITRAGSDPLVRAELVLENDNWNLGGYTQAFCDKEMARMSRGVMRDLVAEVKRLRARQQEWIPVPPDLDVSPELDALPVGTVLFDADKDVVLKCREGWRYWGNSDDDTEAVVCLPALVVSKPRSEQ